MLLPLLHACYTRTTCSALLPCTDCTLAQPLALPTANSPTCRTLYYYLYDCGSTISLLAADAATAAARALPNLRYHRLLSRQAPTPALPTQRVNQLQALCHAGPECVKSESVRTCARMNYQLQLIDKPCPLAVLLCCSFVRLHYALLRHPWHVEVANLLMGTSTCNERTTHWQQQVPRSPDKHRIHHLKSHDMGHWRRWEPSKSKRYRGPKILVALLADCPITLKKSREPYLRLDVLAHCDVDQYCGTKNRG